MKKYWGENEEKLMVEYINNDSERKRNRIITKLYPKLVKMSESILSRYFGGNVRSDSDKIDFVDESIVLAVEKFDQFDPSKGTKAYSFVGTVMRNNYYNKFVRGKNAIEFDLVDSFSDYDYQTVEDNYEFNDYAIELIRSKLVKERDYNLEKFSRLIYNKEYTFTSPTGESKYYKDYSRLQGMIDYIDRTPKGLFKVEHMITSSWDKYPQTNRAASNLLQRVFGVWIDLGKLEETYNERKAKERKRRGLKVDGGFIDKQRERAEANGGWIFDDFTEIEIISAKKKRSERLKKK